MIDPEVNERHCSDKLQTMSHEAFEEFELSFVYGVEATTEDASFVDEMENLILDFVATSVLRCAGEGEAQAVQLRSRGVDDVGVVSKITNLISGEMRLNISAITIEAKEGVFEGNIKIFVHDKDELDELVSRLYKLTGIQNVERYDTEQ